jgi:asparagine synthase (glutamine-hydrolysing)
MCGFAGQYAPEGLSAEAAGEVQRMSDALAHRGPDDRGVWCDAEAGVALGFRRLAILDLSPRGHQPMVSSSGRWVVTFNGEIYNHADLRRELESGGARFHGGSDTEVLLAAVERWGLRESLKRFVGMFALALWDRELRSLHLARDRFGEKPLYYGVQRGRLLWGSELKALRAHPAFSAGIDPGAIALLLRYAYVPAPWTIHEGIRKVPCASLVTFRADDLNAPAITAYWSVREVAENGLANPLTGSDGEILEQLLHDVRRTVREQTVADVPLGAFLSGGIDSSLVVALMQEERTTPVRTFTIGFAEAAYDEAGKARAVAQHLGTAHTELCVTPDEAVAVIPRLPSIYDEPFADASQIPTCLVAALAREHVTVSLSGDGGDEIFGGYNRYVVGARLAGRARLLPRTMRRLVSGLLIGLPPDIWQWASHLVPAGRRPRLPADKARKLGLLLAASGTQDGVYRALVSQWSDPLSAVPIAVEPPTLLDDSARWPAIGDPASRMMTMDAQTYLPDDILVKVDRAAMSASLESRAPFLDHRLAELAWRLPRHLVIANGVGKVALRRLLDQYVPASLINRPKMGFALPLDAWLRGPLRDWADDLLAPGALRRDGLLDPAPIQRMWAEHRSGRRDWQQALWCVLMLQAWRFDSR